MLLQSRSGSHHWDDPASCSGRGSILLLTSCYPKAKGDSAGIFLHYLAKGLKAEGWRVIVQAPNFPGGKQRETIDDVDVRRFGYFFPAWQGLCYRSGMLTNLRQSPCLWFQVPFFLCSMFSHAALLLRRERIDLIHAHWALPQGLVARVLQSWLKVPVVLTVHGGDAFAFSGWIGRTLKRLVLRKVEACTANSSATQKEIRKCDPALDIRLIPMGVDADRFHPQSLEQNLRKQLQIQAEMILFVGRLVEKKGVRHLLNAMPSVIQAFPQAVLVIIGEGTQRKELEELAQRLGIQPSVRFLGRLANEDLPKYYAAAHVFVAPSIIDKFGDTEGLGIVFLEAAASQVAMIGTSVGGISDVLIDQITGTQITPNDPDQLAREINRLLQSPELRDRLGLRARRHVVENFSWKRIAERFTALFQEVIDRSQASPKQT
jgi:glycosyltransferase involved in cell wall biosynthesis